METFTVTIKRINWIDKESSEAEVVFEINGKQLLAFCHPCDFKEGEITEVSFAFLEEEVSENAFWNENKEQKRAIILSESNMCKYYCYGTLKSINPVIVDCGALNFSFGDWINDEKAVGSYVYFVISRLDIFRM